MIALIPARGGSKGLPRKNLLLMHGKPLIAHTIEAALKSTAIDRVIVSTDDEEIACVARQYGAEVPFMRPSELASDAASSQDVMLHALQVLQEHGVAIHDFCLLQPTSPLRIATQIDAAAELFFDKRADSVLSVTQYDHPVQWAVSIADTGKIDARELVLETRRQDLIPYYRPNGAIYIFKADFFRLCGGVYLGEESYGYVMPPEHSLDIDTPLDFVIAEAIYSYLRELNDAE